LPWTKRGIKKSIKGLGQREQAAKRFSNGGGGTRGDDRGYLVNGSIQEGKLDWTGVLRQRVTQTASTHRSRHVKSSGAKGKRGGESKKEGLVKSGGAMIAGIG